MKVISCHIPDYHSYNVKFSPFLPELLACSASKNYGLSGEGAVFILRQVPGEECCPTLKFDWPDGLFDLTWSKTDKNLLATCSGDGKVQIWNIFDSKCSPSVLTGHTKEVYGVDWCGTINVQFLLSASADKSVRLWDTHIGTEVDMFLGHDDIVYSALWAPHVPGVFASISGDKNLNLWDIRAPELLPQIIPAHNGDVLACDWSFLNQHTLATGGVDGVINIWDLRRPELPISSLLGHELAVRRIKFSPFHRNILASASYDFTTRIWDWNCSSQIDTYCYHTEFVYGLDFSLHVPDRVCDCGWDSVVQVYEEIDLGLL